jgi:hypothetical protein
MEFQMVQTHQKDGKQKALFLAEEGFFVDWPV